MGTLDLSLPKKPGQIPLILANNFARLLQWLIVSDPSVMEQYVSPGALVPEDSVLRALTKPDSGNIVTKDHLTGKIIR